MRQFTLAKVGVVTFVGLVAVSNGVSAYMSQFTGVITYFGSTIDGSIHPTLFHFEVLKRTVLALGTGGLLALVLARIAYNTLRATKPDPDDEERRFREDYERLSGRRGMFK